MKEDTKKCTGCKEVKPAADFYSYGSGRLFARCKPCNKEFQRIRQAERHKKRIISQENKDFFRLGATKKDNYIRDLEKALNITETTIKALMEVLKEADLRDFKLGRIPA